MVQACHELACMDSNDKGGMSKSSIARLDSPSLIGKIVLVIALALLAAPQLWYPLGFDQGVYAACGDVIRRGGVPIRDCFETKQPGVMVMYAIPMLFTLAPMAIHTFTLLWTALTAIVIGKVAGRMLGARAAYPAAIFYWLIYAGINYWSMDQAETFANLFLVVALFSVWQAGEVGSSGQQSHLNERQPTRSTTNRRRVFWLALGGVCCGMAFWFKYVFALIAVALAVCLLLHVWLRTHTWRTALGSVFVFGVAALAVAGLGLICFALNNALPALISQFQFLLVEFPLGPPHTLPQIASELARFFNNGADVSGDFKATVPQWIVLGGGFPLLLILAVIGAWQCARHIPIVYVYLVAYFVSAAAVVVWQANYIQYHYTTMIPAFVLLASAPDFRFNPRLRVAFIPAALLVAAVVLLAVRMLPWVADMAQNVALQRKIPREIYLESRVAPNVPVAEYIASHTSPNDTIAIFGDASWVYTLADRRNATRFPFINLWLRDRDAVTYPLFIGQYLAGLQRNQPIYFIITKANFPWQNNDYIPDYEASSEIRNYIESHYAYEGDVGPFLLFKRKP